MAGRTGNEVGGQEGAGMVTERSEQGLRGWKTSGYPAVISRSWVR